MRTGSIVCVSILTMMQGLTPVVQEARNAPSFWLLGILWSILTDGDDTDGRWSLMEQLMPRESGPPPHVHPFNDESFYVLQGQMTMKVGERQIVADQGASIWIPRGTVHSFQVTSETCQVLNTFAPAGMEQVVKSLGKPAEGLTLPPADISEDPKTLAAFANNYWGMEASVPFARTSLQR